MFKLSQARVNKVHNYILSQNTRGRVKNTADGPFATGLNEEGNMSAL